MKLFNITKIVIIATSFITIIKSTELELTRVRPKGRNGWTQGRDFFKIQSSLSTQYGGNNTTVNCAKFNADEITHGGDQFTCLCSNENGTLRGDLCKSGPGQFASEKSFPSNFAQ